MELADTSAWTARHRDAAVQTRFDDAVRRGRVAICDQVKLELLRTGRDLDEVVALRDELESLRNVPIGDRVWRRVADLLEVFARSGPLHHRRVPLSDLLVAAAAERAELPLVHYDRHFDLIAEVTGQPVRALAPLGSL